MNNTSIKHETINGILKKLRKSNKGQYRTFSLCMFLSVLLVCAYSFVYLSPTVQSLLPEGGDTRKLFGMMFFVIILGCTIFTLYGISLFFRYKSREIGVFLVLGQTKNKISKVMVRELIPIIMLNTFCGIIVAIPVSFLIWKLFQRILVGASFMHYSFTFKGVVIGVLYSIFLTICIGILGKQYLRRTNLMDIIYEEKKTEMVHEISPKTGRIGILLIVIGLITAMGIPAVSPRLYHIKMPGYWNLTYLFTVIGMYLFLLSAVAKEKKGKNKEKYYKNIISINMMRFTARQTTKNMCVISLLLFVLVMSAFWGMQYYISASMGGDQLRYDYSFHYPKMEKQITTKEIQDLAEQDNVAINTFVEADVLELIVRFKSTDLSEEGKYFETTRTKLATFIKKSDYEHISNQTLILNKGEYATITQIGYKPSIWVKPDCLDEIKNPVTEETLNPVYSQFVEMDDLVNVSDPFAFVLNDNDYEHFAETLDNSNREHFILFNVKNVMESYHFANAIKTEYIEHASRLSDHLGLYDKFEEEIAKQEGKTYSYSGSAGLSMDNRNLMEDWKYAPTFRILKKADIMQYIAVFVLLSIYIAVISLSSIGIMTYVRSITIAMDNRKLFDHLKKLGANYEYMRKALNTQLQKIYVYPLIAGNVVSLLFSVLMMWFNDMDISDLEIRILLIEIGIIIFVCSILYIIYRLSFSKSRKIIGIE